MSLSRLNHNCLMACFASACFIVPLPIRLSPCLPYLLINYSCIFGRCQTRIPHAAVLMNMVLVVRPVVLLETIEQVGEIVLIMQCAGESAARKVTECNGMSRYDWNVNGVQCRALSAGRLPPMPLPLLYAVGIPHPLYGLRPWTHKR